MKYKFVKWGAFLGELCVLLMLYSATLLAPVPFGLARIGSVLLFAGASCSLAYFASSRIDVAAETKHLSFKQVFFKFPFIVWMFAVVIILLQLASALLMVYLTNSR